MGSGIRLTPFAPTPRTPPSIWLYPKLGAEYGGYLCHRFKVKPEQLIAGVGFWFRQEHDQDVRFTLRWPTLEDKAWLASERLRHRRGLRWSKADAAELADLIDVLAMRASRRSAA
jgi:hypothetical protein